MPFLIETWDKPGQQELRQSLRPRHLDYLRSQQPLLLAAGAKLDDAGQAPLGSFLIVDVEERAQAEAFAKADPYYEGGLFEKVEIVRWRKSFLDGKSFL